MAERTKFERGQLILAPFKGRDVLWTVTAVRANGKAKLTAHFERYITDITTTVVELPDDWFLVTQEDAVLALTAGRNAPFMASGPTA